MVNPFNSTKPAKNDRGFEEKNKTDWESTYSGSKDTMKDLLQIVELLKEQQLLPYVHLILSKREQILTNEQLSILKSGLSKGFEEAVSNLNAGKELSTYQLMKLKKDPDINRAISFFAYFLKGIGKNMKDI